MKKNTWKHPFKSGSYYILQMGQSYGPNEVRTFIGLHLCQKRNNVINKLLFGSVVMQNKDLLSSALRDLPVTTTALKYSWSNCVIRQVRQVIRVRVGMVLDTLYTPWRLLVTLTSSWGLPMESNVRVKNAELCNAIDQQVTGIFGEGEVDRAKWSCSLHCISFLFYCWQGCDWGLQSAGGHLRLCGSSVPLPLIFIWIASGFIISNHVWHFESTL